MRAAVYVRTYKEQESFSEYESLRDRLLLYCEQNEYQPIVVFGIRGRNSFLKDVGSKKLFQLAEHSLIDVVVLQNLQSFFESPEDNICILEKLNRYNVRVDCMEDEYRENDMQGNPLGAKVKEGEKSVCVKKRRLHSRKSDSIDLYEFLCVKEISRQEQAEDKGMEERHKKSSYDEKNCIGHVLK